MRNDIRLASRITDEGIPVQRDVRSSSPNKHRAGTERLSEYVIRVGNIHRCPRAIADVAQHLRSPLERTVIDPDMASSYDHKNVPNAARAAGCSWIPAVVRTAKARVSNDHVIRVEKELIRNRRRRSLHDLHAMVGGGRAVDGRVRAVPDDIASASADIDVP